ncbi:MAG: hypothetical protein KBT47_08785, partial [Armatimonadetes bacterium]|nr:hypothetical protein [Candidatus Hippobium faecium]
KSQYDKFFSPYIGNWGVNYTDGKTYYFKDYNDKKIRLFALDFCLYGKDNEEQISWFGKSLDEAKEKDYSVLIACHSMPGVSRYERINCSFSDLDTVPELSLYGKTKEEMKEYQTVAENFRQEGGKFIAWIGGHCHFDFIGYSDEFPNQLMIFLDSCNRGHSENFSDMSRVDGEKSMDLANALVVDTDDNLLKIVRVGADLDRYMRKRDFLCINYMTKEIYR